MTNQYRDREYKYIWDVLYIKCMECWEWFTKDWFHKKIGWKFWTQPKCKKCSIKWQREYHNENKDMINKKQRDYWNKNKKWLNEHQREYSKLHRDELNEKAKRFREENKEKIVKNVISNTLKHNNELWFNWDWFHTKTRNYVNKYSLRPNQCPICWINKNIVIHHPSYNRGDWKKVVFCCISCHKMIHSWAIKCPEPLDLYDLKQNV